MRAAGSVGWRAHRDSAEVRAGLVPADDPIQQNHSGLTAAALASSSQPVAPAALGSAAGQLPEQKPAGREIRPVFCPVRLLSFRQA